MKNSGMKTASDLRKFGLTMATILAIFGAFFLWRERAWAIWLFWPSGVFLVISLVAPRLLRSVERLWMAIGEVLGAIVSRIILTLTFYLIITPVGLAMRLISGDRFGKRFNPSAESYWVPVDLDGPAGRSDKPY
jgi:hypothetical protein